MSLTIEISISKESIAFELSPAIGFDFLVVANADQRIFWELKPTSLQAMPVAEAEIYSVAVSPETAAPIMACTNGVNDNPPIGRVIYGEVPRGYREVVIATALRAGETYCVFVYGDGSEKAWQNFHL